MERMSSTMAQALVFERRATVNNLAGGGASAESFGTGADARVASELSSYVSTPYLALATRPGCERAAISRALRVPGVTAAFCPSRVTLRRESGVWVARTEPLWPGYVLAEVSPNADEKPLASLRIAGALTASESALVRALGADVRPVPVSEGVIENGRLRVQFGPLAGLEPLVRRVDRHRRLAWLDAGSGRQLAVGLEVTAKS